MCGGDAGRAARTGRTKPRAYQSGAERQSADTTFKPQTNINVLLSGLDDAKSSMAAPPTFAGAGGRKPKLGGIAETHPELYATMTGLREQLASLRGSKSTLDQKLRNALDDFLASPAEDLDLVDVQSALDVKLAGGKRVGMDTKVLQTQIDATRLAIKELRPAWEAADMKPYTFVQEGLYRWLPIEQA